MSIVITPNLPAAGTLALVGSGEYLPTIEPLDRQLLGRLSAPPRVVCLPTAAGTEGKERIGYWSALGVDHFSHLGAQVEALPVIDRASANDPRLAERVRQANFVYLSGGKPAYLLNSLQDTLVWEAVLEVLHHGGVVAGCSAGAMIFGERIPTSIFSAHWQPAFNLLPGALIIPHYDEIPCIMLHGMRRVAGSLQMIGIDGFTALILDPQGASVIGRGVVTVFNRKKKMRFPSGQSIATAA